MTAGGLEEEQESVLLSEKHTSLLGLCDSGGCEPEYNSEPKSGGSKRGAFADTIGLLQNRISMS